MRSSKLRLLSACVWATPVIAAALPSTESAVKGLGRRLVQLDLQPNYAQATFHVPCSGCLGRRPVGQDDDLLTLSFVSHAQEEACGASNITLNGLYLAQEWIGDYAFGSAFYPGVTDLHEDEWFRERDLDLEWNSACLHGQKETDEAVQLLTVNIKAIDGRAPNTPTGFTISFKPHTSPPSLLRLESVPDSSASNKESAELWRKPPQALRLLSSYPSDNVDTSPSLTDSIRELKALQVELRQLQSAISDKRQLIRSQIRRETKAFSDELSVCDSVACIAEIITQSARSAWKVVLVHFSSRPESSEKMKRPEQSFIGEHLPSSQLSGGQLKPDLSPSTSLSHSPVSNPDRVFPMEPDISTKTGLTISQDELSSRPSRSSSYFAVLEIALGIFCCGCLVAVIRNTCSSPRTKAERAAAREERLNVQAYRYAARKHAWRNWWRGNWVRRKQAWRDQMRITDYEEKRVLIQEQEGLLENSMQEEIRQLRAVHDAVNDLVRDAEEGRLMDHGPSIHYYSQPRALYSPLSTASMYPSSSLSEISSRPLSRTDSLPSYRSDPQTEPPSYESDVDLSDMVVDGYRICRRAPTVGTSSHWTPDSSVFDVSPRPSADTLRYPQSILALNEDESDGD